MYYTNIFCFKYSLEAGISIVAWFYISIYFVNCFINIFASDIVEAYADSVDKSVDPNDSNLVGFHYICLVFGIVTILLAAGILLKFANQSETFLTFIVKWNILRCFLLLIAIFFGCIVFDHIFTLFISCIVPITDFCFSAYFTGVLASYLKALSSPDVERGDNPVGSIQLISHKKTETQSKDIASTSKVKVEMGLTNNGTILEEPSKEEESEKVTNMTEGVNEAKKSDDKTDVDDVEKSPARVKSEEISQQDIGVNNPALENDEQCRSDEELEKDKKGSTEDEKGSTEDQNRSTEEDSKGSTEEEKESTEDRNGSTEDEKGSTEDQKGSTEDQKESTEDQEGSAEDQEKSTEDKKGSTEVQKGSTEDQKGSTEDEKGSPEH